MAEVAIRIVSIGRDELVYCCGCQTWTYCRRKLPESMAARGAELLFMPRTIERCWVLRLLTLLPSSYAHLGQLSFHDRCSQRCPTAEFSTEAASISPSRRTTCVLWMGIVRLCYDLSMETVRSNPDFDVGRWLGQPSTNLVGQGSLFAYHAIARYGGKTRAPTFNCDSVGGQRDSTSAALPISTLRVRPMWYIWPMSRLCATRSEVYERSI